MSSLPTPADDTRPAPPAWLWWCFAATIFASAFLLFQVQPMISKIILPWFGGSPAVWTTCLLFFQVLLVVGYGYAFLLTSRAPRVWQGLIHLAPLAIALVALAMLFPPSNDWKPTDPTRPPALQILLLLGACIGLPYFVLSTTGPLLQGWVARVYPEQSAYRFYALSNIGSLGALLSYPFLFEPLMTTSAQGVMWSVAFAAFTVLCGTIAVMVWRTQTGELPPPELSPAEMTVGPPLPAKPKGDDADAEDEPVELGPDTFLIWLILPAIATVMLMAVTTHVCQDINPIPLLWVVPLSLYLLTFIICFDHDAWYVRPLFALGAILSTLAVGTMMVATQIDTLVGGWLDQLLGADRQLQFFSLKTWREEIVIEAGAYFAMIFFVCMVCHGELARRKPAANHLTLYYFLIAVGGALGGLYVALICPLLYDSYLELYQVIFAGLLVGMMALAISGLRTWMREFVVRIALGTLAIALASYLGMAIYTAMHSTHVYRARTFYGVLTVVDEEYTDDTIYGRSLRNGRILHGFQWAKDDKELLPTTYYNLESGFGQCATHYALQKPGKMRMGVVGLGTGTASCYSGPGDYCCFYEINDEVEKIARTYFTFVPKALGKVEVKIGDARLSLENEKEPQRFDVIALDAFSGDAIPAHLLTKEAFAVYLRHLDQEGTIAVHVSNRYLDLVPVVAAIADEHKLKFVQIEADDTGNSSATSASTWVLVTRDLNNLSEEIVAQDKTDPKVKDQKLLWTDDWCPLRPIMK